MNTLSRMMLVVVMLLLPVVMTGASLEVPGAGCNVHNCCVLACCHEHAGDAGEAHWGAHHHRPHRHEQIRLLHDAGLRVANLQAALPAGAVPEGLLRQPGACAAQVAGRECTGPPRYGGYIRPLRC